MPRRTKNYAFRLDPDIPVEKAAMDYIQRKINEGFTVRQIAADAMNLRAGHKPKMFNQTGSDMLELRRMIGELLDMVEELQAGGTVTGKDAEDRDEMSQEERFAEMLRKTGRLQE